MYGEMFGDPVQGVDKAGVKILVNAAKCKLCGDIIESKSRRSFVTCSCGNLSVDGGHLYLKRSYKKKDSWIELSKFEEKGE